MHWLPAGYGGVIGLALADLFEWAIGFIGNPTAITWTARGIGLVTGLAGVAIWASSFVIDMGERQRRPQPKPKAAPSRAERRMAEEVMPAPSRCASRCRASRRTGPMPGRGR